MDRSAQKYLAELAAKDAEIARLKQELANAARICAVAVEAMRAGCEEIARDRYYASANNIEAMIIADAIAALKR